MVPATFDAILPSVLSSCNDSETTLFQLAHASHHTRQLILRLTCVPKANPSKHSSATSTISVSSFLRDPELVHLLISPHPIAEPFPPLRQIGESNAYPLAGGRNIHAPSGEPAILATDPTLIHQPPPPARLRFPRSSLVLPHLLDRSSHNQYPPISLSHTSSNISNGHLDLLVLESVSPNPAPTVDSSPLVRTVDESRLAKNYTDNLSLKEQEAMLEEIVSAVEEVEAGNGATPTGGDWRCADRPDSCRKRLADHASSSTLKPFLSHFPCPSHPSLPPSPILPRLGLAPGLSLPSPAPSRDRISKRRPRD
jgi:hypothetical protein